MLRRDYRIARSYRIALVLELVFALISIAIYYFISETFRDPGDADLGGADSYFDFAVVGVVLTTVLTASAVGLARRVREEQLTGTLEAVLSQPVRNAELAIGLAAYPFTFAALRAVVYLTLAGLLFGVDLSDADWLGAALVLVGLVATIGSLGVVLGAVVLLVKRAEVLTGLVMSALSFLGGAYFPVSVLPGWLETIATVMPTRLAYDGLRSALYEGSGWGPEAAILAAIGLASIPLGVWLFGVALEVGRRRASLTEY
jgi:ABC-2 type transport system permease protein